MTPGFTEKRSRETDIYKSVTMILGSALLTLVAAYWTSARNAVTKEEIPGLIQQYSPYTADAKTIQNKLDELQIEQAKTTQQLVQLQIDTARISEKLGVPASPGVALKPRP